MASYSQTCDNIVGVLHKYFSGVVLTKVAVKEGFAVYAALITTGLVGGFKRYVLAMVPIANVTEETSVLSRLRWVSLQTRTLYNSPYRLKGQAWRLETSMGDMILRNVSRTMTESVYAPDGCMGEDGYEIVLLHDPKKRTKMQYNNKITLSAAVDSFQMVFTRKTMKVVPPQRTDSSAWYHQPIQIHEEFNDSYDKI